MLNNYIVKGNCLKAIFSCWAKENWKVFKNMYKMDNKNRKLKKSINEYDQNIVILILKL